MPAHRDHGWFRAALRSALAQTHKTLEVVVTDDSGRALRGVVDATGDERVRYNPNPRRLGFAGNHCAAIDLAAGDYVAFLHDDDEWEPEFIACAVAVMETNPDVGMVISGVEEIDLDGRSLGRRPTTMPAGVQSDALSLFLQRDFMLLLPSATVFRRAALDANARPWPDVIAADLTMFIDPVLAGWGVHYEPAPLTRYRTHPGQIGTDAVAHRTALIAVWSAYRFDRPGHEVTRRARLASAHAARAGALAKAGRGREARKDLLAAARLDRSTVGPKSLAVAAASLSPRLTALAERLWRRVHDPVSTRHGG